MLFHRRLKAGVATFVAVGLSVVVATTSMAGAGPTVGVNDLALKVSNKADRSGAVVMRAPRVSGKIAVFLESAKPLQHVQFRVNDNHSKGAPLSVDYAAPYDLVSTAADGSAVLFDTAKLPNGKHYVSAWVKRKTGTKRLLIGAMYVNNPGGAISATTTTTKPATSTTTAKPAVTTTSTSITTTTTAKPVTSTTTTTTVTPAVVPGGFPNEKTTGVPAGTVLKPSGSLTIDKAGTVLDGLHIKGSVTINAENVVIRRSLIEGFSIYAIRVTGGSVLVEDVEINGLGKGHAAVCCRDYTLNRVNVHNVTEGPRLGSNTVVTNSYIHHLVRCTGCHVDVLQSTGGTNITVKNNNLQAYNPVTGDKMNAAFQFGEESSSLRSCLFDGNLMNGGNFTVNGGGGGTKGAQCTFRNNQFGRDYRYGAAGNIFSGVVWESSNVYADTKLPVR